jgi:uncharacterized membrane protein (Fun14 family)
MEYAIKKEIRIVAVVIGLFVVALTHLEYQRIISLDYTSSIAELSYMGSEHDNSYIE